MKPFLIAAALALAPVAAHAQVAAGSVPNTFDRPAAAATAQPAAPAPAPTPVVPADPRSEDALLGVIAAAQAGAMDYSVMTDDLAAQVRQQAATVVPLIQGFGAVETVEFVGSQNGVDFYAVAFANAATQWAIGFNDDKISALVFRPAE